MKWADLSGCTRPGDLFLRKAHFACPTQLLIDPNSCLLAEHHQAFFAARVFMTVRVRARRPGRNLAAGLTAPEGRVETREGKSQELGLILFFLSSAWLSHIVQFRPFSRRLHQTFWADAVGSAGAVHESCQSRFLRSDRVWGRGLKVFSARGGRHRQETGEEI